MADVMVDNPTGDVGPLTYEEEPSKESKDPTEPKGGEVIPEKFDGKSIEDVIKSYSELEKVHGRQSQELGELRRMADNMILEKTQTVTEAKAPVETKDIYEDPDGFVAARVNEAVKPLEARLAESDKQVMLRRLEEVHPDYREVASAPDFLSWVNEDSYRRRQYKEADSHDFAAANNLFNTWKETQAKRVEAKELKKEEQLKDASMVTGSTGETSKTIYNRAALVQLQLRDPAKYEALQAEIFAAYAEGRVR